MAGAAMMGPDGLMLTLMAILIVAEAVLLLVAAVRVTRAVRARRAAIARRPGFEVIVGADRWPRDEHRAPR